MQDIERQIWREARAMTGRDPSWQSCDVKPILAKVPDAQLAERIMGRPVSLHEACRIMKAPEAAQFLGIEVSTLRNITSRRDIPISRQASEELGIS